MSIAERVKARRLELNLTQVQLGKLSGLSQQSVQSIEKGEIQRPRRILEISHALHCSVEWLCYGFESSLRSHTINDNQNC
ncbi:helix-turn-helix domain-containing protein [Orbus wheelerorum]|uniref:helix-turn-helix domain-containing protein n=1 Tax=Orbus wheelerorum TaxID=3074111 RepID=UPI00370DC4C5